MAAKESNRPRNRSKAAPGKVQLTKYYRSGDPRAAERSPFRPSVAKAKRRRWLSKFIDVVIIAAVLFCLAYSLIIKPTPKLQASDASYRSVDIYRRAVTAKLEALRNRNKITFNESGIKSQLTKEFPEVTNVSIELPLLGQTPSVKLEVSQPAFFLTSANQRYIINSQGRAAAKASDLPQIKDLQVIIDQSGFNTEVGKRILSAPQINFIKSVIAQTKHGSVPIQSLTLPPLAAELDLRTTDRPYLVKFFLGGDALQQAGQYLAARHNFDQKGPQPEQYLDVRVPGKIFYK